MKCLQLAAHCKGAGMSWKHGSVDISPCWLPWRSSPPRRARSWPERKGSDCGWVATRPPPCTSETRLWKCAGEGRRIVRSVHTFSSVRPRDLKPAFCSQSRTCPPQWAWTCSVLSPKTWDPRWSNCAEQRAPWFGTQPNGKRGPPCSRGPFAWCTRSMPSEPCSSPHRTTRPPEGRRRARTMPRTLRYSAESDMTDSTLKNTQNPLSLSAGRHELIIWNIIHPTACWHTHAYHHYTN